MATVLRFPLRYEDMEEPRTFQEILDSEPVFDAPIRDSEWVDDFRYKIGQIIKENVEDHPLLLSPRSQVYLASRNLVGEAWKELKEMVEPFILYRYKDNLHPLKVEDKGVMRLADFIFLMRVEKVKQRMREKADWYDYQNEDFNDEEHRSMYHLLGGWDEPPYYLPQHLLERKMKLEGGQGERRVRAAVESPGGNPDPAVPGPSKEGDGGEEAVEPIPERPYEEHPLLPILEVEEEAQEQGREDEDAEEGNSDEWADDEEEEEDPEEEEEEEEEGEENPNDENDSSVNYTLSSSSSSSPGAGGGFERQIASDYYSDSQNELDDPNEKYRYSSR